MRLVALGFLAVGLTGCPTGEDDNTNHHSATTCTTGQTRCSNTVIQTCSATQTWVNGTDCAATSQTCTNGACTGGGCTDSGATQQYYVCDSTEVVACNGTTEAGRWDCADDSGTCFNYGGSFGADCVAALWEACIICLDEGCTDWYPIACGLGTPNPSYGCDLFAGCVSLSHGCVPANPFTKYCDGDHLVKSCVDYDNVDFPLSVDCTSTDLGGGTCNGDQCEHSTVDGYCDNEDVVCVGGLTCNTAANKCE